MKTLKVKKNGKISIPKEYHLSETKRRQVVTQSWVKTITIFCKNGTYSIQQFMRHKKSGDKPYIEEGFMEIDGERFRVRKIGEIVKK